VTAPGDQAGDQAGDQDRFSADDGSADPVLAAALAGYAAGRRGEQAVLALLAGARLLIPIVPMPDAPAPDEPVPDEPQDAGPHDHDCGRPAAAGGAREMAMPRLVGADGRPAILAFTCLDALTRWQPAARPVPADAAAIWRTAAGEPCAVVIDVAGPVPLAVEGARLAALAAGTPVPGPHEDPDVRDAVAAAVAGQAPGARFELRPAPGEDSEAGPDLVLELALPPSLPDREAGQAAGRVGQAVLVQLGGRLRRGIAIALR
jgi:hypothetical protein